jgi:rhodanese-related sulfurtransferase
MPTKALQQMLDEAMHDVREIGPHELHDCLARVTIIDVREKTEVLEGYLPGAANVPRGRLEFDAGIHPGLCDREREIVLYSNAGLRSLLAAQTLKRFGFSNVASLSGGIDGWLENDLPVE